MKVGEYCRTDKGKIGKIVHFEPRDKYPYSYDRVILDTEGYKRTTRNIIKCSEEMIDLVEYMDLLWLEHPIKLYDSDTTIGLFNPVRCDGFTTFEDGTHCIILNLDYIVDIKNLKIKGIITHEQIESMEYKVKE